MISLIYNVTQHENEVSVSAIIEDAVLTMGQTLYDPPEYGPALCNASFTLDDGEELPIDDDEMIKFIEGLDLEWEIEDNTDEYTD